MGVLGIFFNNFGSENYSGKKIPWTVMSVQVRLLSGPQKNDLRFGKLKSLLYICNVSHFTYRGNSFLTLDTRVFLNSPTTVPPQRRHRHGGRLNSCGGTKEANSNL